MSHRRSTETRWNPEEEASIVFQETLFKDYQSHVTIHHSPHTHTHIHTHAQPRHSSACRHSSPGDVAISGIKHPVHPVLHFLLVLLLSLAAKRAEADFNSPLYF